MLWYPIVSLLLLVQRAAAEQKVVSLRTRRKAGAAVSRQLIRRGEQAVALNNAKWLGLYEVDVMVGNPPQAITLDIDTGSSDIWMYSPTVAADCHDCIGGSYDPLESRTSTKVAASIPQLSITYQDGRSAIGDYYTDDFAIGAMNLENVTFALATNLTEWDMQSPGILGIGMDASQNPAWRHDKTKAYDGLLDAMVRQEQISTRSYSLWLDGKEAGSGTILFGGYDASKYTGDLTVHDMLPDPSSGITEFLVPWTSLNISTSTSRRSEALTDSTFSVLALLDSGTQFTYVPGDLYDKVYEQIGAYVDNYVNNIVVPCNVSGGSLDFGFGNGSSSTISVPFSELAPLSYNVDNGSPVLLEDGTQACDFGLRPAASIGLEETGPFLFGDTFLRSAYVVYNIDTLQIAIAQSDIDSARPLNVLEIRNDTAPFGASTSTTMATSLLATATPSKPMIRGMPYKQRRGT